MLARLCFHATLAIALLPALLFAGRPLWVLAPAAVAAGLVLIVAAAARFRAPNGGMTWSDRLVLAAGLAWLAVIGYAASQAFGVGPAAGAGGDWAAAAGLTGQEFPARGSLNAGATALGCLRLSLYAGVFLLAYWTCRGRDDAWRVMWAVVGVATAAALYAVLAKIAGVEYVLWQEKRYYVGYATGPFPNRNTFATFLAIGLAANVAIWARALRRAAPGDIEGQEKLRLVLEFATKRGVLLAAPGLLMALAGLMTGSRAGLAAMALAVVATALVIALRTASARSPASIAAIAGVVAILGALWALGGSGAANRGVSLDASYEQRAELFQDTRRMIAEAPLAGVGLGAFPEAIHRHKTTELTNDWRRAHNVYLEAAAELGLPAAALMLLAVGLVGFAAARAVFTRRRLAPMAAASVGGLLAAAAHSLVDFPLQEPAVVLVLALTLGAAASQADSG